MTDNDSTEQSGHQRLHEIFVNVTGESVLTDQQDQGVDKKVVTRPDPDA